MDYVPHAMPAVVLGQATIGKLVHRMMVVFAVGRVNEQVFCHNNRIISTFFSVNDSPSTWHV